MILHLPTEFNPNGTNPSADYDIISIFQDAGHRVTNLLPKILLVHVTCRRVIMWNLYVAMRRGLIFVFTATVRLGFRRKSYVISR